MELITIYTVPDDIVNDEELFNETTYYLLEAFLNKLGCINQMNVH